MFNIETSVAFKPIYGHSVFIKYSEMNTEKINTISA